jgi:lantibiotic modifying enzyme
MSWQPLDDDDPLRPRIDAALGEIAERLAAGQPADMSPGIDGLAGVALFFAELAHALPARFGHHAATADAFLDRAGENLDGSSAGLSFFDGFPGVAWVGDHVRALRGESDLALNAEIDDAIVEHLSTPTIFPLDVSVGLVGLAVYALERAGTPAAERIIALVVERLAGEAEHAADGMTFRSRPAFEPAERRDRFPDGSWDFGLAHGIPGVIHALSRIACEASDPRICATAREMRDRTCDWLLSRRRDDLATSFPPVDAPGHTPTSARTAWCYGDPGVAIALLHADRIDDARSIARRAASRAPNETGVVDGAFCHGAAGLAQIFARLDERQASRYWLERTVDARPIPTSSSAFLAGGVGIGLALVSAISVRDPSWDRLALLSRR